MIDARLPLALDGGGLVWPEHGPIAIIQPNAEASLPGVPRDRAQIIHGFKPTHDAWQARGYDCTVGIDKTYAAAIVCLPRAKTEARALLASSVAHASGIVVIDGQKTDGVDSVLKDVRKRVQVHGPVSKAHGKLFWFENRDPEAFRDWDVGPALTQGGFWTAPGVFSADAVDPASALLASALPEKLGKRIADLGAGWGYLSAHVLTRSDIDAVHLVEANHMALECARRNVADGRARFHWADATSWSPPEPIDTVVMNPPFHTGRAADPDLGRAFMQSAARVLHPQGQLWMVANRHLPYESTLRATFAHVTEAGADTRFKLFRASRPLRKRA
ncbi:class I SAM-dependent methyltransferase [Roseobacter sp. YSTF-M11]|uniref:Class I SAM-dependent methyltransferase n=1 Tax=Roseobacter insulae TaxID=2859783 RepID=A0A9X1FX00_9RHOB|nr:class I SAM-dependent methyltransferase [Roseobacter insulae]MBW4709329.1 class I SAM-dependent methyltransferase [Roseobacter insulae]